MELQEDDNDMCEKILKQLQNIINEDQALQEFSMIPAFDKNVSPIKYNSEEHCVGLETWCARLIFKYALQQIFTLRRKVKTSNADAAHLLNRYLIGALLIQPELTTFWNIKRELLEKNWLDINGEYKFSKLVLSRKNKSYEAFTYRRHLYTLLRNSVNLKGFWDEEHEVLLRTFNSPNNYHAWNHRIWCFENIVRRLPKHVLLDELQFSKEWIFSHVSEHSGFHYRQHVLSRFKHDLLLPNNILNPLFNNCNELDANQAELQFIGLLFKELFEVTPELHRNFPAHESIWCHRRFIMHQVYASICGIYQVTMAKVNLSVPDLQSDINVIDGDVEISMNCKNFRSAEMETSNCFKMLLEKERAILRELIEVNRWSVCDVDLLRRYEKWLRCFLGICL